MSEDAPVNIGAATVWPDPDSAYFAVRRQGKGKFTLGSRCDGP